jgi:hypothetical protein
MKVNPLNRKRKKVIEGMEKGAKKMGRGKNFATKIGKIAKSLYIRRPNSIKILG